MTLRGIFALGFACALACMSATTQATPASAANTKVIRWAMLNAETGFDPHAVQDLYSNTINDAIFDPLLKYDYLARPVKLKPNTADAMPTVTDEGRVYTFHVKPGIYFADDPAFKGMKRELTAQDYAFSLKRLLDPQVKSPWLWYVEGKIVGGDEAMAAAKKAGRFDYDAPIRGIETPNRYTLRVTLKETDYNFIYVFATVQTAGVAREVVEAYPKDMMAHPVGTGPYRLTTWKRSHFIVLEANPNFREELFDAEPPKDDAIGLGIAQKFKGRRLPMVPRIEISVIEESQPRWLAFLNGDAEYANAPIEFTGIAFPGGKVAPNLARQGIRGEQFVMPDLVYTFFNLDDPVVGGYTPEKVALRRAMALAYNYVEDINVIRTGGAVKAESGFPPGVEGYDANFRTTQMIYDPARARALLDLYGYVDRDGDGYREFPDGKKLTITMHTEPDSTNKQFSELWRKNLDAVGLRVVFNVAKWQEINKQARAGKVAMWQLAWSADYPDGENFLQNLYGPNSGQSNYGNFKYKPFDDLYERAKKMPPSPERNKLYADMNRIAAAMTAWIPQTHRIRSELWQPWLVGYRKHPIYNQVWMYLDIDESKKAARQG